MPTNVLLVAAQQKTTGQPESSNQIDNSTLAYQSLPRITNKKQQGFPHHQVKEAQPMEKMVFKPCDNGITSLVQISTSKSHAPCPRCGSNHRLLGASRSSHFCSLLCALCNLPEAVAQSSHFIRWIGKSELVKIQNQGGLA